MKHVGDLLAVLPLPAVDEPVDEVVVVSSTTGAGPSSSLSVRPCHPDWIHDLGADLPAGHLHLWGGPPGVGKTSFLLSLVYAATLGGRRALYATYHLSASSLALRLLSMAAGVDVEELTTGALDPEDARRAARMRHCLQQLPLWILEARGFSVTSIEDRTVRMPFRADVLAVDYLQAVVRPGGGDLGSTVRGFTSLASRLHLAVVVALQGAEEAPLDVCRLADRAGWIARAGGSGLRRAEVIRNRYGDRSSVPLRIDASTGGVERMPADRLDAVGG